VVEVVELPHLLDQVDLKQVDLEEQVEEVKEVIIILVELPHQ
jgi:hypothetical protein